MTDTPHFPLSAVVGADDLKLALYLTAIDPKIGGVLIEGPRGMAKSTLARGLADLLASGQFVTLPLGATEERLVGTLDLDTALSEGRAQFSPGVLAKADGGVLYVDEVNLLPDHLVDLLLDVAASGTNLIERDGISHRHSAKFVLIGTMNPEEGELRPQLLDRFGLNVALGGHTAPEQRGQIIRRRLDFDSDPQGFCAEWEHRQQSLRERCEQARCASSSGMHPAGRCRPGADHRALLCRWRRRPAGGSGLVARGPCPCRLAWGRCDCRGRHRRRGRFRLAPSASRAIATPAAATRASPGRARRQPRCRPGTMGRNARPGLAGRCPS
jgi:hypothetical protein